MAHSPPSVTRPSSISATVALTRATWMRKRKPRECRICRKRPVWICGDVGHAVRGDEGEQTHFRGAKGDFRGRRAIQSFAVPARIAAAHAALSRSAGNAIGSAGGPSSWERSARCHQPTSCHAPHL